MKEIDWITLGMLAFFAALFTACGLGMTCHVGMPGDGVSVGTIVNVGEEGIVWKRPSVYLLHAGEMNAEEFAVEPDLIETAHRYSEDGVRVRIHYTSYLLCARWHYSGCAVVDRIEPDVLPEERR